MLTTREILEKLVCARPWATLMKLEIKFSREFTRKYGAQGPYTRRDAFQRDWAPYREALEAIRMIAIDARCGGVCGITAQHVATFIDTVY